MKHDLISNFSSSMQSDPELPDRTLEYLVEKIITSRKLNRNDQRLLMTTFASKTLLNKEDEALINQVFDRLQAGLVRIVD